MFASLSCEKEKDISGDSRLKVFNKADNKTKVYFDEDLIGKMDGNSSKSWSVPSGNHTVKATSTGLDPYKKNIDFPKGMTFELTLSEDSKAGNTFIVVINDTLLYD